MSGIDLVLGVLEMPVETVYVTGHAALPQGMAAKSLFDTLAVAVEAEARYGVILRATATLATEQAREFFARVLVGRSLNDGVDEVVEELRQYYQGSAQNALVAATKDLWRRWQAWKEKRVNDLVHKQEIGGCREN